MTYASFQMTSREARKSKSVYGKWKQEDLKQALVAVSEGVGINEAARMYSVPQTTLKRYKSKGLTTVVAIGHPTDLPAEIEADLVQHLLQLETMFYG